ncbi:hypothetical protein ABQE62_30115 [Mycolicibacterium fortuitum]
MSTSTKPLAALAVPLLVAGCTFAPATIKSAPEPPPAPAAAAPTTPAPVEPPPAAVKLNPDALTPSFTALAQQIPGQVGVAIFDGNDTMSFGTWSTGPAWSTIKVPLAIAAARHDLTTSAPLIERAITASDNAAADQLWASLGEPAAAAAAVNQVLVDGANPDVQVQADQIRPPYSPYGQTIWSQADAARFAWALPCIPDAELVLAQMHNITPDQQWGLAATDNTAAKGGWGPDPDGNYLARQIGIIHTETGTLGVAIATTPDDGTFTTATALLNSLANWVTQNTTGFPAQQCAEG